jgi:uncharacterized membrane protein YbaN (DUF454 family)
MNEALNGLAKKHPMGAALVAVIRAILVVLGFILMIIAVPIGFLTPILPIGAIIGLFGLVLVATASKTLHRKITNGLRRLPWLWKHVGHLFGEKSKKAGPAE